jgi:ATP-binding cassette, subfamily B, multidrug efflux pump
MSGAEFHEEDVLGKAYDGRLMRRLLVYLRPYRPLLFGAIAVLLANALLALAGPLFTRQLIDVALPARDAGLAMRLALVLAAVLVVQFALEYAGTMLTSLLGQRVMRDLRMQIFAHLQRLSVAFFDRTPVGRLITRVTSDVEALNELFTAGVVAGVGDLFTLGVISVVMLIIDWRLALAAFAVIPFVLVTSYLFRTHVRQTYRDIRTRLARINAFLQERLTGLRVVQLFGREAHEAQRFDALNRVHLDAHLRSIRIYALYFPAIELLTSVALASLIVAGADRVTENTLTVGTVAAFLQFVRRFFQPLQDLSEKYNILQAAMASSERIFQLLDTEPTVRDAGGAGSAEGAEGAKPLSLSAPLAPPAPLAPVASAPVVTVEFEDVWFAYSEPEWVLRGVTFCARPGETVALVGHTGAGKTTIISLLLRFYDPQRGRITIAIGDAAPSDIRELPLDTLRSLIGYVQQDIFLFAGDITSNIRLSAPLADDAVVAAASQVGADRVIRRLPRGYAHELGERGASVSVGERQLLSFARAIASDPALLLLDEATSAVDSEVEAEIQRALAVLMKGRTTIAVAHRLSTVMGASQILVLHHGAIRERGTHRELLARGGLYERLFRLQAGLATGAADTVRAAI